MEHVVVSLLCHEMDAPLKWSPFFGVNEKCMKFKLCQSVDQAHTHSHAQATRWVLMWVSFKRQKMGGGQKTKGREQGREGTTSAASDANV